MEVPDIIDEYGNYGSKVYAPETRYGQFPDAKPRGLEIDPKPFEPVNYRVSVQTLNPQTCPYGVVARSNRSSRNSFENQLRPQYRASAIESFRILAPQRGRLQPTEDGNDSSMREGYVKTYAVGVDTSGTPEEGTHSRNGLVIVIITKLFHPAALVL
jgi:hypothetical protein